MANLDTRDKRGSSISKLGIIIIYPNADDDNAEDSKERMQTVGLYAGISPSGIATVPHKKGILLGVY